MTGSNCLSLLGLLVLAACTHSFADRFSTIEAGLQNGTPRALAFEILGTPSATHYAALGNAEAEWAEWREDKSAVYTIAFIQGRAVFKAVRPQR